ncbi:hypothetical protein ACH4ZX_12550 [Streptomyces sp. NPDC020490]|uniref:hypothetical protein n=1 Tax=Streptomyces sp. NPDC020490 TaxID=3365078 RepID=UPI00379F10BE
MSSSVRQTAPPEVPPGTRLVLYACLPPSLDATADNSVRAARRYARQAACEVVEEYVDRADPMESRAGCHGWHNALAAIEQGRAAGIVTPLMVMLGYGPDSEHLASWQARTGAHILTSSCIDTPVKSRSLLPGAA